MKTIDYIKDKFIIMFVTLVLYIFLFLLLLIFNINGLLIFFILFVVGISYLLLFIYDFGKKKIFYDKFKSTLDKLDKKYLIVEMINNANFLEAELMLEYLYEIDKDMHEEVNEYRLSTNDFKEYIEMWCHEIKTPIATSKLVIDNNKNEITESINEELDKIEAFVEQVLYYSKTDNANEDYIIKNIDLKKSIDNVIKRNKKDLLKKKIKIEIGDISSVSSDSKWIEFIINQIVNNAIKYSSKNPSIKFETINNKNNIILNIIDNGIGIPNEDLDKVFKKGYTGINGRIASKSTGIGLYLCKKLCLKLGHDITIYSKVNDKTIVSIIFPKSSMTSNINKS